MSLMANRLYIHKPFFPNKKGYKKLEVLRLININWWLVRIPQILLASPAAYGVYAFAKQHLPPDVAALAGWAYESAYLGAIALADQQYETDQKERDVTTALWWLVNIVAVVASILSNLLFFSGYSYASITAESITHAVPLPLLGFFYGLLMHRQTTRAALKAQLEYEQLVKDKPYMCEHCEGRFKTIKALNGHKAQCSR